VVAVAEELGLVAEVLGAALWSAVVLLALLVAEVELEAGGFTGALALSLCPAAGLVVVAAGALLVLVEAEAAFWSVVEDAVPEAGGFTGALALSAWLGACVVLVVACGALALLVSVVGDCALPGAAGVVLLAEDALLLGAVVLVAAAFWSVLLPAEAWLLVQESEIIFTELTCNDPSLPAFRKPVLRVHHAASGLSCRPGGSRSGRYRRKVPSCRLIASGSPSLNSDRCCRSCSLHSDCFGPSSTE
jgi:hypothetical protein